MSDYTAGENIKISGAVAGRVNLDSAVSKLENTQCTYTFTGYIDTYSNFKQSWAESDLRCSTSDGQYLGYAEGYGYGVLIQAIDTKPAANAAKQQINGPKTVTIQRKYGTTIKVRLVHQYFDRSVPVANAFAVKEYTLAARAYEIPRPPKSVTAKLRSGTKNTIDVSWVTDYDSSTGARPWTGVYVYRYLNGSTSGTLVATLGYGTTSFTDSSVEIGNKVVYGVYSYNSTGKSTSDTKSASVFTYPKAPSSLTVKATEETASSASSTTYNVTWACSGTASNTWEGVSVQRQLDDGSWTEIKKMSNSLFTLKDTVAAGHKIRYRVAGYNTGATLHSDFTYADAVYNAPTPYTSISAEKSGASTVKLTPSGGSAYIDSVEWQRYYNGSWASVSLTNNTDSSAPTATIRYRARKKKGSLYSAWRESADIQNVRTPLAPTLSCPLFVKSGESCTVYWTRNHPDYTAQSAAQVKLTPLGGSGVVRDISGTAASYTFTASRTSYAVKVRTKGLADDWGEWSAETVICFMDGLTVTIDEPALDYPAGDAVTSESITVKATVTSECVTHNNLLLADNCAACYATISGNGVSQSVELVAGDATTKTDGSYAQATTVYEGTLENIGGILDNHDYTITVSAQSDASSVYDAETYRVVHTEFPEPTETFNVDLAVHEDEYSVSLVIDAAAEAIAEVEDSLVVASAAESEDSIAVASSGDIDHLTVSRVDQYGEWETIATNAKLGDQVVDRLPPLNVDFSYVVRGYNSLGAYAAQEVPARVDSRSAEVFNFGPSASEFLAFELDAESSRDFEFTGTEYQFALGGDADMLPTFYADGGAEASGQNSYKIHSREEYDRVFRTVRKKSSTRFWFRDYWGHRIYAHGKWSLGYSAQSYGLWDVSVSPSQVVWRTPQNG